MASRLTVRLIEDLTRDELAARLVTIRTWEHRFQEFDEFAAEGHAITALLAVKA